MRNDLTIGGLPVIESAMCQDVPRFTLSPKVPVTLEFRQRFDRWARDFFGVHDVAYKMTDPISGRETLVTAPRVVAQLRASGRAQRTNIEGGEKA